jgi:hypothetical protein
MILLGPTGASPAPSNYVRMMRPLTRNFPPKRDFQTVRFGDKFE